MKVGKVDKSRSQRAERSKKSKKLFNLGKRPIPDLYMAVRLNLLMRSGLARDFTNYVKEL